MRKLMHHGHRRCYYHYEGRRRLRRSAGWSGCRGYWSQGASAGCCQRCPHWRPRHRCRRIAARGRSLAEHPLAETGPERPPGWAVSAAVDAGAAAGAASLQPRQPAKTGQRLQSDGWTAVHHAALAPTSLYSRDSPRCLDFPRSNHRRRRYMLSAGRGRSPSEHQVEATSPVPIQGLDHRYGAGAAQESPPTCRRV